MGRVPDLDQDRLTAEQKRHYDEIAGTRSRVGGPFAIWLRLPQLADKANRLGNVLRAQSNVDRRLFELMVLTIARHWSADYEWCVHEDSARKAGLPGSVIEAIRAGHRPTFERDDERLIHKVVAELNETRKLSQDTYDAAAAALGLDLLIELIAAAGFYTMVAMTLNGFDVSAPDGARPFA